MRRLPFVLLLGFLPGCSAPPPLPDADAVSSIRVFIKFPPVEWRQREAFITDRERIREFLEVVGQARPTGEQADEVVGTLTIDVVSGEAVELGLTEDLGITAGRTVLDVPPDWVQEFFLDAGVIEPWDGGQGRMGDGAIQPGNR